MVAYAEAGKRPAGQDFRVVSTWRPCCGMLRCIFNMTANENNFAVKGRGCIFLSFVYP